VLCCAIFLDSRFRGNDRCLSYHDRHLIYFIIPAYTGIRDLLPRLIEMLPKKSFSYGIKSWDFPVNPFLGEDKEIKIDNSPVEWYFQSNVCLAIIEIKYAQRKEPQKKS